jgi:DNA-binding PadR family transcriptional regulator
MDDEERDFKHQLRAEKHMMLHKRNWMRHTAMVPKGFIRHQVLEALNEKPMSGSEIMEQIQKQTGSFWKPSPGSIYPLLAWLQDNEYVKELPSENGLKRYELTQSGKGLLEEQKRIRNKFREQAGFMPGQFFGSFIPNIPPEKLHEIRDSMMQLAKTLFKVGNSLKDRYSEEALNEALHAIDETSKKLEEINQKLKGEKA